MTNELFTDMSTVYKQRSVLSEDYQPESILEREDEKQAYGAALSPILNGDPPNNVFVYGNTGVGKTAVTRYMFDQLQGELNGDQRELTVVWQNCRNQRSSYQVAVSLVNQLRDDGNEIAETGHPAQRVYNALFEEIERLGGTVLVVLDEVDSVGSDDDLLYELPRARANGNIEDAHIGVVGISNDYQFRDELSPQVKDTLCEKEITFPAYDANELVTILRDRVQQAFNEDVVEEGVVEYAAALAAKDSGSARQAIDLLREAGDMATERENVVTETLVEEATERIERANVQQSIEDLTAHAQLALATTTYKSKRKQDGYVRTSELFDYYEQLARRNGYDPISYKGFRNRLDDLSMMGFLSQGKVNEGERGGRSNTYTSDFGMDLVMEPLDDGVKMPEPRHH